MTTEPRNGEFIDDSECWAASPENGGFVSPAYIEDDWASEPSEG